MWFWSLGVAAVAAALSAGMGDASGTGHYPFTGFFADGDPGESAEATAGRCALSFFEQKDDGSYAYYHLDSKAYEQSHRISYLQYATGTCTYSPESKLEICKSVTDLSSRDDQAYSTYGVFTEVTPDAITYSSFDSLDEAKAAIAANKVGDAEEQGSYRRCPTDPAKLKGLIAPETSAYSEDDIGNLSDPDEDTLNGELATSVAKDLAAK